MKTGPLVIDAFPLLVLARKQNGWEMVRTYLQKAIQDNYSHVMSLINLGEVYYTLLRDHGEIIAFNKLEEIRYSPIQIVNPGYDQMLQASKFKALGGVSYADCFASALAIERDIPVLTGDPEFKIVEAKGVKIEWLPSNR